MAQNVIDEHVQKPGAFDMEDCRRIVFKGLLAMLRREDEYLQKWTEEKLATLEPIEEAERREIYRYAFDSAKNFWEEILREPDQNTDIIMVGRMRLTQISEKLEQLNIPNPPE